MRGWTIDRSFPTCETWKELVGDAEAEGFLFALLRKVYEFNLKRYAACAHFYSDRQTCVTYTVPQLRARPCHVMRESETPVGLPCHSTETFQDAPSLQNAVAEKLCPDMQQN